MLEDLHRDAPPVESHPGADETVDVAERNGASLAETNGNGAHPVPGSKEIRAALEPALDAVPFTEDDFYNVRMGFAPWWRPDW